jgi:MFS transporter, DHA3 family, macrolide efflux protein
MEAPASPGRLWNRNFTLLWLGQTISQLGNPAFSIGAMYWMMEKTGSASLMGLMMTAAAIPSILLAPFGGTFADRHSRVRIMVLTDLLSGLAVLALAAVLWMRPDDTALGIPILFAVSVTMGITRAFFMPAEGALLPDLVPQEKLPAANSLNQLSVQASMVAGQGLGGFLFSIDGVSYLIAAVCALLIPRDTRTARPASASVSAAVPAARPFRQFLAETAEGFRYVWAQKGQRDFLFAVSILNFLAMPGLVLFPFYVERYLHEGPKWYGFLMAGISVGSVLGFVIAGVWRLSGAARARGILGALLLYPIFFGSLAIWRQPVPALLAIILGGVTAGFVNVYLMTMVQTSTPEELRGRVMAFLGLLAGGLMPVGMALGGVVGDLTDKNVPLVIGVCAALVLLDVLLLVFRRPCREYLAS